MDGNQLATSSLGIVRLWDVGTGRLLGGWSGTTETFVRIGHSIFALLTGWFGGPLSRCLCRTSRRKSYQRRLILKGLLRDRHMPPTRQNPSFVLPPLSRRLDSRCTSSERNEKILGNRPDGCFLPSAGAYAIVSKEKTLLAEGPIPERRQALGQVGTSRKGLRPGADAGKPIGIEEALASCEATPESHSPGWARLVLRWGGWEIHFNWFFDFRDTNRHDANSIARLGSNTYRPVQNLLPDEFLDVGQVSVSLCLG